MIRSLSKLSMAGLLVAGVLLAGTACAAGPSGAAAGPAVTPSATPAPDVDPLTTVRTLVVRPEALELQAESGSQVASLRYDGPLETMLGALSVVLGEDPVTGSYEGGLENPPGETYSWAGLTLVDFLPPEGKFLGQSDYYLHFTASQVGEAVTVTTTSGHTVGDDAAAVADELGLSADRHFDEKVSFLIEVGPELAIPAGGNTAYPNAWSVHILSDPAGLIAHITAPVNLSYWVQ